MGIPDTLIGRSPRLILRSRDVTPDIPLLTVNELSAEDFLGDCFELVPPALPLEARLPASPHCLPLAHCDHFVKSGPPPSPLWPRTPPALSQFMEHNTFLTFCDDSKEAASPLFFLRPRALSVDTGRLLKSDEPWDDNFTLPEPKLAAGVHREQETWPEELDGYQDQWFGLPVTRQEFQLSEDDAWLQPSPVNILPAPPPMPQGADVYKPHWPYGSAWPFNCAPTTLTLENLPSDLAQEDLTQMLDEEGFNGLYDFLFLPLCEGKKGHHGIINFSRHSYGLLLAAHFNGRTAWGVREAPRPCKAQWSFTLQGLPSLLEQYRNDEAMHESVPVPRQPALFCDGWRVSMPAPTIRIRRPRGRLDTKRELGATNTVCEQVRWVESESEFPKLG